MMLEVTVGTIGNFPPKRQLSLYKPFRSSFKAVYDFTEKLHFQLGVRINPEYKTSCVSLSAKQAITIDSSSGFNVKLLHVLRSA